MFSKTFEGQVAYEVPAVHGDLPSPIEGPGPRPARACKGILCGYACFHQCLFDLLDAPLHSNAFTVGKVKGGFSWRTARACYPQGCGQQNCLSNPGGESL